MIGHQKPLIPNPKKQKRPTCVENARAWCTRLLAPKVLRCTIYGVTQSLFCYLTATFKMTMGILQTKTQG